MRLAGFLALVSLAACSSFTSSTHDQDPDGSTPLVDGGLALDDGGSPRDTGASTDGNPFASLVYHDLVVKDGATGYWRMNTSNPIPNIAGGPDFASFTLIPAGSPLPVTSAGPLANDDDKALVFDGASQYAGLETTAASRQAYRFIDEGKMSVECWASPAGSAAGEQVLVSKRDTVSPTSAVGWALTLQSGVPTFGIYEDNSVILNAQANKPLSTGWHYIVGSFDTTNVTVSVDGEVYAVIATGALHSSTAALEVGRSSGQNVGLFGGSIDEVAVYPTALGADVVSNHFHVGIGH